MAASYRCRVLAGITGEGRFQVVATKTIETAQTPEERALFEADRWGMPRRNAFPFTTAKPPRWALRRMSTARPASDARLDAPACPGAAPDTKPAGGGYLRSMSGRLLPRPLPAEPNARERASEATQSGCRAAAASASGIFGTCNGASTPARRFSSLCAGAGTAGIEQAAVVGVVAQQQGADKWERLPSGSVQPTTNSSRLRHFDLAQIPRSPGA